MWYNFNIYNINFDQFKNGLLRSELINKDFFFIRYFDSAGFHFRLRVSCQNLNQKNNNFQELKKIFKNSYIKEHLYDPEINKYENLITNYEKFSSILSREIILLDNIEKNPVFFYQYCISFLKSCSALSSEYLSYHLEKWKPISAKPIKINTSVQTIQFSPNQLNSLIFFKKNIAPKINSKQLTQNILHMVANKLGISIPGEVSIINQLKEDLS